MSARPGEGRPPAYDVAILGGGLAGLSLAVRLASMPACRTVVIEPRTSYGRDRTWCAWRLGPHPFRSAVVAGWDSWEVLRPGAEPAIQRSRRMPYEMIPADGLYGAALDRLSQAPNVELRLGCRAGALAELPDRVGIETDGGPIEAALAFDSRLPPPSPGGLVQRFLGQEVETEGDVFDPGRATLMDFRVPQRPGAVRFMYLLPTSPRSALVEDTWFAAADAALPDGREAIRAYLRDRFGLQGFRVGFEETGAIPMDPGLEPPRSAGRVIPIGTAGGAIKPSSGYGFTAIQRMADALAADLAAGRRPAPFRPRDGTAAWMDAVFLQALRDDPADAPRIFWSLFAGCAPEPLVRFLNDVGSAADRARVVAATPKAPLLRAALATTSGRGGGTGRGEAVARHG